MSSSEISFVDEQSASAYDCGICLQKLREPVAVCDNHIFCDPCIQRLIESSQSASFPCPACRVGCHYSRIRKVQFIVRRMHELQVRCPNFEITPQKAHYMSQRNLNNARIRNVRNQRNVRDSPNEERARSRSRERNENQNQANEQAPDNENENEIKNNDEVQLCQWTGNWSDLHAHVDSCALHMVCCGHCPSRMMRSERPVHVDNCGHVPIPCRLCDRDVKRARMNSHIDRVCVNKIVPCPKCGERMIRGRMARHLGASCPEFVAVCKYHNYGCSARMRRRLLAEHERQMVSEHLTMVENAHGELKDENGELEDRLTELEGNQEDMQEKIDGLNEEINDMKEDVQTFVEHILEGMRRR